MRIKFLAPAALTGLVVSALVGVQPVAAQSSGSQAGLAGDSTFVQMAGSLGLLQVKLGMIAEKKGTSPNVREFGKRMVEEYTKTNEQLAAGAKQAAFPSPVIIRQHNQLLDRFTRMGRGSFDKNYMAEMVKEHDEAAQLFKQEAESGRVASLKKLASGMLPAVQQHLSLATQTAGSVGAEVTAATTQERKGS